MEKYVFGNWKMNKDSNETHSYANQYNQIITSLSNNVCVGLAIPFVNLSSALSTFNKQYVNILAQNISEHDSGAFTSQISASMLKAVGINKTLIGHSEVRQYLGETNQILNKKIIKCLQNNITPILCIGETLKEFETNRTKDIIIQQLTECLANINNEQIKNIIIAYEPIWAIGTGKTATTDIILTTHKIIRDHLIETFGTNAHTIPLLYGGSVTVDNAKEILMVENVNGLLVGGASLKIDQFCKIINIAESLN